MVERQAAARAILDPGSGGIAHRLDDLRIAVRIGKTRAVDGIGQRALPLRPELPPPADDVDDELGRDAAVGLALLGCKDRLAYLLAGHEEIALIDIIVARHAALLDLETGQLGEEGGEACLVLWMRAQIGIVGL